MAFGGMKQSGQGREIGPCGLDEFLEVRTAAMRVGGTRANWVRWRRKQGVSTPLASASWTDGEPLAQPRGVFVPK